MVNCVCLFLFSLFFLSLFLVYYSLRVRVSLAVVVVVVSFVCYLIVCHCFKLTCWSIGNSLHDSLLALIRSPSFSLILSFFLSLFAKLSID